MGREKKPLVMSDLGCADSKWVQRTAWTAACGRRGCNGVAGNGWGEEAAGDERAWLRGRLRTANGCGELRGRLRTAWVPTEWLEMGGEKKPLVMSDLGCADGCGRQMGAKNCADGCGRRGCNGVAGNGWGKGKGRERIGKEGTGGERKGQEGKGRERMGKERKGNGKEGKGRERKGKEEKGRERMGKEGKGVERTAADCLGARESLEMGGEKKPLVMSEFGCADGCGRGMGAEKCADCCGWRECNGVAGNGWGEEAAGDERAWLRGRLRTAKGCGKLRGRLRAACATEWLEMCREKKPLVIDERPWLRERLRTANRCEELRGRLRTAWVQGGGWKWVERRSRW